MGPLLATLHWQQRCWIVWCTMRVLCQSHPWRSPFPSTCSSAQSKTGTWNGLTLEQWLYSNELRYRSRHHQCCTIDAHRFKHKLQDGNRYNKFSTSYKSNQMRMKCIINVHTKTHVNVYKLWYKFVYIFLHAPNCSHSNKFHSDATVITVNYFLESGKAAMILL